MKMTRPSKSKVLLIALIFGATMVLAGARPAHACFDPLTFLACGYAAVFATVIAVAGTYVAAKATVCTPVAAYKASDHPNGFTGAFGDCFSLRGSQSGAAVIKEDAARESDRPPLKQSEEPAEPATYPDLDENVADAPAL